MDCMHNLTQFAFDQGLDLHTFKYLSDQACWSQEFFSLSRTLRSFIVSRAEYHEMRYLLTSVMYYNISLGNYYWTDRERERRRRRRPSAMQDSNLRPSVLENCMATMPSC